jgi:hypothetical protein
MDADVLCGSAWLHSTANCCLHGAPKNIFFLSLALLVFLHVGPEPVLAIARFSPV